MPRAKPKTKKGKQQKVEKVMREYAAGELHSGSKSGPVVKNRDQAVAIALNSSGISKKGRTKKAKKKV